MYIQTKQHLNRLQDNMRQLGLWQASPPPEEAFNSIEPFAIDAMSATEWLQWVFIPRMQALADSRARLPSRIAVSPYIEEALKETEGLGLLLAPLLELEKLLQES
ncbi:YqcC family protein [Mesocricetibacter intestinalis]|uniref:YqcC family protein n=1 Tax=Mesocricetibacter intestinalis TaxID=1521930 RepID=UPI00105D734B|nr:YqcC family protein [Mesocricetibacter intestinalis]